MPIANGSAATVADLVAVVVDHLTDNGWSDMGNVGGFKCLRAPGSLAGHEFFFWLREYSNPTANAYGFEMRASTAFNAGLPIAAQANISPLTFFNLWNVGAMDYWIYSNARRVIVIAKCATVYISMYAGALLPLATPAEMPKPFYISGSYNQQAPYNVVNSASRFIADPGVNSAYVMDSNTLAWLSVGNHGANPNADVSPLITSLKDGYVWPMQTTVTQLSVNSPEWSNVGLKNMRPALDAPVAPVIPCYVMSKSKRRIMGIMDGVVAVPGFGRVSGQILTEGGINYRAFQNMSRVTGRDFMAIKEV